MTLDWRKPDGFGDGFVQPVNVVKICPLSTSLLCHILLFFPSYLLKACLTLSECNSAHHFINKYKYVNATVVKSIFQEYPSMSASCTSVTPKPKTVERGTKCEK